MYTVFLPEGAFEAGVEVTAVATSLEAACRFAEKYTEWPVFVEVKKEGVVVGYDIYHGWASDGTPSATIRATN